ncbi:MAG: TerB N-terminal domain-containing protein [Clostridia bacterium]|nr:TerB N-terminal domain-containing protein [Clostridia bacterium]
MPGKDELDNFWDLDALLPPRNKPGAPRRDSKDPHMQPVDVTDVRENAGQEEKKEERARIPDGRTENGTPEEDVPEKVIHPQNSLLQQIWIYPWKATYHYYDHFCKDAEKYWNIRGEEAAVVPFFSYVPQYSQMNREQMKWYLWWRRNVREENIFLPTDMTYILLYTYEIINLSDKINTRFGMEQLFKVWVAYREAYPRLDRILSEWLVDYCLLHGLSAAFLPDVSADMIFGCTLKEFFLVLDDSDYNRQAASLIMYCSTYDYKKSKYANEQTLPLMEKHITGALAAVLAHPNLYDSLFNNRALTNSNCTRQAFSGALCAPNLKKRIEVDYLCFTRSYELRFLITDFVKYAENKVRDVFGIKSKLKTVIPSNEMKYAIDEYFEENLPAAHKRRREEKPEEAYEKYYDLPKTELSAADAKEIEETSWSTTKVLVETFADPYDGQGDGPAPEPAPDAAQAPAATGGDMAPKDPEGSAETYETSEFMDIIGEKAEFLRFLLKGQQKEADAWCRENGLIRDAVADEINSAASEILGDILLENDGSWHVIEDYRDMFGKDL